MNENDTTTHITQAEVLAQQEAVEHIRRLLENKCQQLQALLQSLDWDRLPTYEQAFAAALLDDLAMFITTVDNAAMAFDYKLTKFATRVRAPQGKERR
jgi:hypothetical protein